MDFFLFGLCAGTVNLTVKGLLIKICYIRRYKVFMFSVNISYILHFICFCYYFTYFSWTHCFWMGFFIHKTKRLTWVLQRFEFIKEFQKFKNKFIKQKVCEIFSGMVWMCHWWVYHLSTKQTLKANSYAHSSSPALQSSPADSPFCLFSLCL